MFETFGGPSHLGKELERVAEGDRSGAFTSESGLPRGFVSVGNKSGDSPLGDLFKSGQTEVQPVSATEAALFAQVENLNIEGEE